ncbi:MAG: hypothetical protein LBF92_09475 [Synergistaceae bacterium]|nr:hypothetical protein [Synergistaceae bacterium]
MRGSVKVSRSKLFLFVAVFALAVLALRVPLFYGVSSVFSGDALSLSEASAAPRGANEAQRGMDVFWDGTTYRLHVDIYADSYDAHDYQKAAWRHQPETGRRTARDAAGMSPRSLRSMVKAYESEYIRSAAASGFCAVGSSADMKNWLKAIERLLPS